MNHQENKENNQNLVNNFNQNSFEFTNLKCAINFKDKNGNLISTKTLNLIDSNGYSIDNSELYYQVSNTHTIKELDEAVRQDLKQLNTENLKSIRYFYSHILLNADRSTKTVLREIPHLINSLNNLTPIIYYYNHANRFVNGETQYQNRVQSQDLKIIVNITL